MNGEIDMKRFLQIVIKRKKFILFGTLLCLALAGVLGFILPKTYLASLMLEVGQMYLSKMSKQEMEYLEEPSAVARVIGSSGSLDSVRQQLQLDIRLEKMGKQLNVRTFKEDRQDLPVLEVFYGGRSPGEAVEVVTALAQIIIQRHAGKFRLHQKNLEDRIKHTQEKIAALEKIIAAQNQYRDLSQKYIDKDGKSVDEFLRDLGESRSAQASPVDVLFLQSSGLSEKRHLTDLTKFKADMEISIGDDERKIADARIEIADLRDQIDLSFPTGIRSPAVPPERPIKPNKASLVMIGGVLGLALTTLAAFFREYLRD